MKEISETVETGRIPKTTFKTFQSVITAGESQQPSIDFEMN